MNYTSETFNDNHTNNNYWRDDNVFEYGFEGKCPSKAQVLKVAKIGAKSGASLMELWWGENMLEFDSLGTKWIGRGWIRSISGQDMAVEL